MRYAALIVVVLLLARPVFATDARASLFFTPGESETIAALIAKEDRPDDPSVLKLEALFYYGPEDWVFWLGTKRWTPGVDEPRLHVVGVAPDEVRLRLIDAANTAPRDIILKPHQIYRVATDEVVER